MPTKWWNRIFYHHSPIEKKKKGSSSAETKIERNYDEL